MPLRERPIAPPVEKAYVTWEEGDSQGKALAFHQAHKGLKNVEPILRATGTDVYLDVGGSGRSIRDGYDRADYENYRPGESLPKRPKTIIKACMDAYDDHGIIRNVIDLMGDFATQGIDVNHPNERIETFYKEWFRKISGKERSERFLNYLYRCGNVIVKRQTAKLKPKQAELFKRGRAGEPDVEIDPPLPVSKREVPWRYVFLNPLGVDVLAPELSLFSGTPLTFAIKVPSDIVRDVRQRSHLDPLRRRLVDGLPAQVRQSLQNGDHLPLDPDKTRGFYYKRDDWAIWAKPMVYSILPDLNLLKKMKLADLSALDGAISSIRVWKLGSLEHRILPTAAAMNRLAEMLLNNVGGGVMDLIWDCAIELIETKTDVHHFLGETKYAPVLTSIYAGIGIPPTLTGAATQGGFTNNFISLKTLTERLQYGRDQLAAFWAEEIRLVQRAMGFRLPATLVFDRMTLSDEAAEKQLLLHLADRNYISVETLQERFGETPEIEEVRIRREQKKRKSGQWPQQAGPFHVSEKDYELKKLFTQLGVTTPSELGLELEERKPGEVSPAEQTAQREEKKLKGEPGQGRPKLKKDETKRKPKEVKPRTSATFVAHLGWAKNAQTEIAELVTPAFLKATNKKTLRQLTHQEAVECEDLKFRLLCQFEPGRAVTPAQVKRLLNQPLSLPLPLKDLMKVTLTKHVETYGEEPSVETQRLYQAAAYALFTGDVE